MRRWCVIVALAVVLGCGDEDDDDGPGFQKQSMPLEKVPAVVMKTAKEARPDLTFYAAYHGQIRGPGQHRVEGEDQDGQDRGSRSLTRR